MNSIERKQKRYERRIKSRKENMKNKTALYDDFQNVVNPDNLYSAFKRSRKGVAWKESVQRYEMNLFRNIAESHRKLLADENVSLGFVEFDINERGKMRHIRSVHISERVIQKCLCDTVLIPIISRSLIYDNGASLKNKGLHFAIKRLVTHLSRFYRKNGNSNIGYCLSVDFSKYFDSIRHDVLFQLLEEVIQDEKVLNLTKSFVAPFGDGISLGLGSQVSQIAALFIPNKMDHYIKEMKRIKYYGRYMDDFYLIHKDKAYLKSCLQEIKRICTELGITINERKSKIVKLKDGVKFLKGIYLLTETGKIIKRSTQDSRKRQRRKIKKFKTLLDEGRMSFWDVYTAYQSWRGNYRKRFDAFHTIRRMDGLYNGLFINNHQEEPNGLLGN